MISCETGFCNHPAFFLCPLIHVAMRRPL
uniref:Uncharacterized protein n=1 Tax=Anguilla anguilla TaxID=7936 RepID=A0A0E9QA20_ANGAN